MPRVLDSNLKEQARLLGFVGEALYKVCGQELADGIWEEFKQLVMETAQYTGSTAASWNIGTKGAATHTNGGGVRIRSLGPGESPLQVGHMAAVSQAINANEQSLDDLRNGSKRALNSGINVWNDVPWASVAEEGPLRPENAEALGAFERFQSRVNNKVFMPIKERVTLEQLIEMAKVKK